MAKPGKQNTITDVPGLKIGQAQDAEVKTGVTVIVADEPAIAAVSVAGGGPGTRETDVLAAGTLVEHVDAVCLSGGSAFGLAAADGVMAGLKAQGRGFGLLDIPGVPKTPIVPSAILYDLANGGDKDWGNVAPYAALGRRAFDGADTRMTIGRVGAGHGARAGQSPGGTGSASVVTNDGITMGAVAAVNCFGAVRMPGNKAFWAWPYEQEGEFGGGRPDVNDPFDIEDWGPAKMNPQMGQNTTIACVATDAIITPDEARRVASMALSGFSRAIRPVFSPYDGDVVFVLSTGQREIEGPRIIALSRLGELAASTLARSIARGVFAAEQQSEFAS